jgi:MFS family permease
VFSQNGLSLDQAPPISVIFRFFFSGALFGILSGIFILFFQNTVFDADSIEAVTLTHTFTLGVMLSFMFAALFQMLPVIAGVTLTSPVKKANFVQYPFILGIFFLLLAFNLSTPWLFTIASLLLGVSILYICIVMVMNLIKLPNHSSSSKGILTALLSLGIIILLALYMTGVLGGAIEGIYYTQVKTAHYSFGLFGWISLLIISISFQVIEMFYVTPPYPKLVSKYLPLTLLGLLVITTILGLFDSNIWKISKILLALLLTGYALLTLKRLTQRKRPLTDATVWFWRMGLSSLVISMLTMSVSLFTELTMLKSLSYIFFVSFSLSIVFAMFYKIVPFLTWFHLNSQGYFTAPMMHEVIHPKTAMKHLYIHLATVLTFILSIFISPLIIVAGVLTILSFGWMSYQIIHAHKLYIHTQKTGEKFDMGNISTS